MNIYHFHGYSFCIFTQKIILNSTSSAFEKNTFSHHWIINQNLKLTVMLSLPEPKAQVAFLCCLSSASLSSSLSSWFCGIWGLIFVFIFSPAIFFRKDHYMYWLNICRGKSNYLLFHITCMSFSTNHCIIYIQRKKNMVDLICYNHLNLNITNFTFIIAHFIVVSIHLFSPRGKQIFVDM